MSVQQYDYPTWEDVENLYENLNVERERFSMTEVQIMDNPDYFVNKFLQTLKDKIQEMTSNSYISTTADTKDIIVPKKLDYIFPWHFLQFQDLIDKISDVCLFDPCTCFDYTCSDCPSQGGGGGCNGDCSSNCGNWCIETGCPTGYFCPTL